MHTNTRRLYNAKAVNQSASGAWLEYEGPLTDRLIASVGEVRLDRVFQDWIAPSWWDRWMLEISEDMIFQREIIMRGSDCDYWYARTVIPQQCFVRNPAFFNRLQHESLRNLIYDEPMVTRKSLISYSVDAQCIEFQWVTKYLHPAAETLWLRLAEFQLYKQDSFYLIEVLLPALEQVK